MTPDLIIANAVLDGHSGLLDIAIAGGRIVQIAPNIVGDGERYDAGGRLLTPGLVECHIHLDKAGILHRAGIEHGTLQEAVSETARLKAGFTSDDVYARAAALVEQAIGHGTMVMRSYVEVDPRAGLRSFDAIKAIKRDYAHAIDIEICAFAQEGLTQEPLTQSLLETALADGADLVGGCSYMDADPGEHIRRIFEIAERFGVAADFHVDFDLVPTGSDLPMILREVKRRNWPGYVSCGHATKLSTWPHAQLDPFAAELAQNRIGIVSLPATDLFLLGRSAETLIPRGVAPLLRLAGHGVVTAVASNNVLNPFTPYGDASLVRMANLFANLAHLATDSELDFAFAMVSALPAKLLGRSYGVTIGGPADLVLFDATTRADVVRQCAPARQGWKAGKPTFLNPATVLYPGGSRLSERH